MLGLTDTYKNNAHFKLLVEKLMSVPYLPAHLIEGSATELFTADVNTDTHTMTKIRKLKAYFFRFWGPHHHTREALSVSFSPFY